MSTVEQTPLRLVQHVARRVREMRLSKGMTQEQAAAKGEMPFKRWQLVERGTLDIHLSTLARVARALGVPPFFLLMPMHGRAAKRKPGRPPSASAEKTIVPKKRASPKKKATASRRA